MSYAVDLSSPFIWVFVVGMVLKVVWRSYLSWRDDDYVLRTEKDAESIIGKIHTLAKSIFTRDKLERSRKYELTTSAFSLFHSRVDSCISLAMTAFGAMPFMLSCVLGMTGAPLFIGAAIAALAMSLVDDIWTTPFNFVNQFKIEERFGFNTMTRSLFWKDFMKGKVIEVVMTFGDCAITYFSLLIVHTFYGRVDALACLVLAGGMSLLSMLLEVVHMSIIVPMFNKLEPMEDCDLKKRMESLLKSYGYNPSGLFVIDQSKRSKHSNAYCSGWGKNKKIVLFDTMLKSMSDDEILAIIGHELAHAKLKHLVIDRVMSFVGTFLFLWIASMFVYNIGLLDAFGYRGQTLMDSIGVQQLPTSPHSLTAVSFLGLTLFGKIYAQVSWILRGLSSWMSRKMEFAADRHSCKFNGKVDPMITSLFKLYNENLSYPISDPLYESWNFSHPSLLNRVSALNELKSEIENREEKSEG